MPRRSTDIRTRSGLDVNRLALALRLALAGSVLMPLGWHGAAQAQGTATPPPAAAETAKRYDIPPGPLGPVLARFAAESGVLMAGASDLVEGRSSPGLRGSYAVTAAFDALLSGSGLQAARQPNGSYALVRAPAAVPAANTPDERLLPAMKIRASAVQAQQGYRADSSDAIAPGLSLQETPAVVNVVTDEFLKDTGATRFTDVLNYVPGVTTADNVGSPAERITIRGFPLGVAAVGVTGTYFNGMRQAVTRSQYRALENIERVEIVKGPAGVEASVSDPGGYINFITKKPQRSFAAEAKLGVGDAGYRTLGVDVTGPAGVPELQYRLIAVHNELATWRPGRQDRPQNLLAPSLNWDYAPGSHLTLEYEQLQTNDPLDRGTIYLRGAGFKNDFAGSGWSFHQASDSMPVTSRRVDLDWTHALAKGWQARLRLQRMTEKEEANAIRNVDTSPVYAADGLSWNGATTIPIYLSYDRGRLESQTAEVSVHGEFDVQGISHALHLGVSRNRGRDAFISHDGDKIYWDNDNSIDLFAPNNGQVVRRTTNYAWGDFRRGSDLSSFFGQWLARWTPTWRTVLSLRRDDYDGFAVSETLDGSPPGYHPTVSNQLHSWRLASSYDLTPQLTLFSGYANSFVPQAGADRAGQQIDPLRAQSIELGLKASLFDGQARWTNSLFQITQDHQTVCDPIDPVDCKYLMLYGKVRMRGFESELVGRLSADLKLSTGLSLMQPKILENGDGYAGNRYPNVPTLQASAYANYRWTAAGLPDLSTRLGVIHVGQRQANSGNTYQLPAYTRVDAGIGYAFSPRLSLDLNVENLFDKTYYTSAQDQGTAAGQIGVGNRRLVQLLLRMKM